MAWDDTTPVPGWPTLSFVEGRGLDFLSFMATKLIRHYGRGHLHFITFTCYRRLPLLRSIRARSNFVQILGETHDCYGFSLVGCVVMPNHIHLLISEPTKGTPSTVLQVLKQRVSRRLRSKPLRRASSAQRKLPFRHSPETLPRFGQYRFYDFNVWSQTKFVEKLHYMHMNPVRKNLVTHPKDWPWSSFSYYARRQEGLLRIDSVS
jgi:putative transposase